MYTIKLVKFGQPVQLAGHVRPSLTPDTHVSLNLIEGFLEIKSSGHTNPEYNITTLVPVGNIASIVCENQNEKL